MAELYLFKQQLKHTVPVQYDIKNEDLSNLVSHYNNGVNAVTEQFVQSASRLPIEVCTYQEFVDAIQVPNHLKQTSLLAMQRQVIENSVIFTEQLSALIGEQEKHLNPFVDQLRLLLDFEKLSAYRIQKTARVYELLQLVQELRNVRAQVELRLVNVEALTQQIRQIVADQSRKSEIRQRGFLYENERRIKNRQSRIDELDQKASLEEQFRRRIGGEVTDIDWLVEQVDKHYEIVGEAPGSPGK